MDHDPLALFFQVLVHLHTNKISTANEYTVIDSFYFHISQEEIGQQDPD